MNNNRWIRIFLIFCGAVITHGQIWKDNQQGAWIPIKTEVASRRIDKDVGQVLHQVPQTAAGVSRGGLPHQIKKHPKPLQIFRKQKPPPSKHPVSSKYQTSFGEQNPPKHTEPMWSKHPLLTSYSPKYLQPPTKPTPLPLIEFELINYESHPVLQTKLQPPPPNSKYWTNHSQDQSLPRRHQRHLGDQKNLKDKKPSFQSTQSLQNKKLVSTLLKSQQFTSYPKPLGPPPYKKKIPNLKFYKKHIPPKIKLPINKEPEYNAETLRQAVINKNSTPPTISITTQPDWTSTPDGEYLEQSTTQTSVADQNYWSTVTQDTNAEQTTLHTPVAVENDWNIIPEQNTRTVLVTQRTSDTSSEVTTLPTPPVTVQYGWSILPDAASSTEIIPVGETTSSRMTTILEPQYKMQDQFVRRPSRMAAILEPLDAIASRITTILEDPDDKLDQVAQAPQLTRRLDQVAQAPQHTRKSFRDLTPNIEIVYQEAPLPTYTSSQTFSQPIPFTFSKPESSSDFKPIFTNTKSISKPLPPPPSYSSFSTENHPAVSETTSSSLFSNPSAPIFSNPSTPTFSNPSTPTFSNPSTPIFSNPSTPTFSNPSTPTFSNPSNPIFSNPSTPTFSNPSTPTFSNPSTSTFSNPLFSNPSTPTLSNPSTPTFSNPSTPIFSNPSTPTLSIPSTPTFSNPSTPAFSNPSKSLFSNPSNPIFSNPPTTVLSTPSTPTLNAPSHPTFTSSVISLPTFSQPSTPSYNNDLKSTSAYNSGIDADASIISQNAVLNQDDPRSYAFDFETSNGIKREEVGFLKTPKEQVMKGQYSYIDPDGKVVEVSFISDSNGFRPQGGGLLYQT